MKRKKISKEIRQAVLTHGKEKCAYCGRKLDYAQMTIDHVRPLDKNGDNSVENFLPACKRCNNLKANMTRNEFRLRIRGLIGKKNLSAYERQLFLWYNLKHYKKQSHFLFYYEQHKSKRNHWNQAEINIGFF